MRTARKRLLWLLVFGLCGVLLWFIGFDRSVFFERCPDCRTYSFSVEYRIFGFTFSKRTRTDKSTMALIAEDLGIPCPHARMEREHVYRFWGLLICAWPCRPGIRAMVADTGWYGQYGRDALRRRLDRDPSIAEMFRDRVFVERDMVWYRQFVGSLRTAGDEAATDGTAGDD